MFLVILYSAPCSASLLALQERERRALEKQKRRSEAEEARQARKVERVRKSLEAEQKKKAAAEERRRKERDTALRKTLAAEQREQRKREAEAKKKRLEEERLKKAAEAAEKNRHRERVRDSNVSIVSSHPVSKAVDKAAVREQRAMKRKHLDESRDERRKRARIRCGTDC